MKNEKIFIAIFTIAITGLTFAGSKANASWKDYFDKNEIKAINNYIASQVDANSKAWKGVISDKQVGDSITKRKIYTGTMPDNGDGADKYIDNPDGSGTYYFKKISAKEIKVDDNPQISAYMKSTTFNPDGPVSLASISSNLWSNVDAASANKAQLFFEDGNIWVYYGAKFLHSSFQSYLSEYKIVVNY